MNLIILRDIHMFEGDSYEILARFNKQFYDFVSSIHRHRTTFSDTSFWNVVKTKRRWVHSVNFLPLKFVVLLLLSTMTVWRDFLILVLPVGSTVADRTVPVINAFYRWELGPATTGQGPCMALCSSPARADLLQVPFCTWGSNLVLFKTKLN